MNKSTDPLEQLIHLAAQAAPAPCPPLSFRTEERSIASWRDAAHLPAETWETQFYKPALAAGASLVLLSLLMTYFTPALNNMTDLEWSLMAVNRLCAL